VSRARQRAAVAALATLLIAVATAEASHLFSATAEHTTLTQIVTGDGAAQGYSKLRTQAVNRSHLVRDHRFEGSAAVPTAQPGRALRRRSLAYFGQLTDFQLADEESPARVEFADQGANSAWRPNEAFAPFVIDYSIRQVNLFADASPVKQGAGNRARMDFALMTGDQADNQQRNETVWVRELLEGGRLLNFNTGSSDPADYDPAKHPSCVAYPPTPDHLAEAPRYTGVQDFDDYDEGPNPYYYDPDDIRGSWAAAGWPTYTGLMDRAQRLSFTPAGLDVPAYLTNGNHDVLVQGNEDAIAAYEELATGCEKPLGSTQSPQPTPPPDGIDPSVLLAPPTATMRVPPDPQRQFVSKPQLKQIYGASGRDNAHGFGYVDPLENAASNGSATYYAWDPPQTPGLRFISIDTNSEGGVIEQSSNGNIDDPQFRWLKRELDAASARDQLIIVFGHHPVRSLTSDVPDEATGPCTGVPDSHGHDHNPGCDLDPRNSGPVHLGRDRFSGDPRESLVELFDRYPHVIGYVAGHTHENNIDAFPRSDPEKGVWWGIETSATADWPVQHRLIEVMDNRDGTLSIFGTLLDAAAPAAAPAAGAASNFTAAQLASIGRELAYNDPQSGAPTGEGGPEDKNVELLVRDPRKADLAVTKTDSPDPARVGRPLTYTVRVENGGAATAAGVALTDTLPSATTFASVSSTQGTCSRSGAAVKCSLGSMAGGSTATVRIVVRPTRGGTITNTASVTAQRPPDPNPGNNRDTEDTRVVAGSDG
jgi:uncharacterized repeat protein (TIGR01451 family)